MPFRKSAYWNWHGVVAVILALGVSVTLILAEVNIVGRNGSVTTEEATLISTAFGAAIGAIATYLGGRDEGAPRPTAGEGDRAATRAPSEPPSP